MFIDQGFADKRRGDRNYDDNVYSYSAVFSLAHYGGCCVIKGNSEGT